jgi:hypothetical protein
MIPELTYYDMEHNPQKIKELYSESRRFGEACGFLYTYVDINLQKDI